MKTYTISNIAGGNERSFRWSPANGLSWAALKHAIECSFGFGPVFGGEAAAEAEAEYTDIHRQYVDGECSERVAQMFTR